MVFHTKEDLRNQCRASREPPRQRQSSAKSHGERTYLNPVGSDSSCAAIFEASLHGAYIAHRGVHAR